ncbi:MAG: hypothetical protein JWP12_3826 [Bacteroidetes bacterium]|nr:hypothetical protein [Bacteroidota bacterium]
MKLLKRISTTLLILIVIYCLISFFIPSKVRVERSVMINAPAALVFEQVNNFKNWTSWSYWDNIDPDMKSTYEGPEKGKGAVHKWTSQNKDVGTGSIMITESTPNVSILTDLHFGGMPVSHGGYTFKDTTEGVYVTTYMNMDMGFFGRIFPGLMMDKFLGTDFEKTLTGLKKQSELVKLSGVKVTSGVEETVTKEQILASYRMGTNMKTIATDIAASYQKIGKFMLANKLTQSGPACAFYHGFSADKIDMECAIPIDKEVKGDGMVNVNKQQAGNAVVIHFYGPYMGTASAHATINKWITEHHKKITGSPWEVYVTDPMVEKDTAKWLTEVYYPIE